MSESDLSGKWASCCYNILREGPQRVTPDFDTAK